MSDPEIDVIAAQWPLGKQVVAFTTTRIGGLSRGRYQGLNLATHVGDDMPTVLANRALLGRVCQLPAEPVWLDQIHGGTILEIEQTPDYVMQADGSMTSRPGVVCAVMTADCIPLLLCDENQLKVAAIHVGWRGMAVGIVEQAVGQMQCPTDNLCAWAGPAISGKNFQIGSEVKQQLGGPESAYQASPEQGKYLADLYQLLGARLEQLGVKKYQHYQGCTWAQADQFYSHRRDGITGRMLSLIYLRAC